MQYNGVIEVNVISDLATEPVTLIELKQHLNMQFDTSGSFLFNDDDSYLTSLITQVRKYLEKYTGLSFGAKTITAIVRNELGDVELPGGPIGTINYVKDSDGNSITDYVKSGISFKKIVSPFLDYLEVNYTAGYTTLPEDLKRAILEECEFRYNNRGSQQSNFRGNNSGYPNSYCESSLNLASQYKRGGCFA